MTAMDLMRSMANEKDVLRKLQQTSPEHETDIENETGIIISSPSDSLEPIPIRTATTCQLNTDDYCKNELSIHPKRKPSKIRPSTSAQSASHKWPVTQASPSKRASGLKTQAQSTSALSSPNRQVLKTSNPSLSSGSASNHKSTHPGTSSRPRGFSMGSKTSHSSSGLSPSHRPIASGSSGNRERTSTSPSRLHSPSGRASETSHTVSSSHASYNSEKSHSPKIFGRRRHSATPSLYGSDSSLGKKAPTTGLSPSSSPRVSPTNSPRTSPRASHSISPTVSLRKEKKSTSQGLFQSPPKPIKAFPFDPRPSTPSP